MGSANYDTAALGATSAFLVSGGRLREVDLNHPIPLVIYILVYFVINNRLLVAFYHALAGATQPLRLIFDEGLAAPVFAVYGIIMLFGIVLAVFMKYNCYWGILLICGLLWLVEFTYRRYFRVLQESLVDSLIGLRNRRFVDVKLEKMLKRNHGLSILLLDVDHFKGYNDKLGHPGGDVLLRTLANVLRHHLQSGQCVCRYGGEEFVAILPSTSSIAAMALADTLRTAVEAHRFSVGDNQELVTVSIGVSTYPDIADTKARLLASADTALYHAKESGRNTICLAT